MAHAEHISSSDSPNFAARFTKALPLFGQMGL
jgi:hypothetical protein